MSNSNMNQSKSAGQSVWQTSPVPCILLAACAVVAYGSVLASTAKKHEVLTASRGHAVAADTSLATVSVPAVSGPALVMKSGVVSPALIAAR